MNISSGSGYGFSEGGRRTSPDPWGMVYGVTKAGVIRFTRALATALAGDNINVNCVCLGQIYTPFWEWVEWVTSEKMKVDPEAKGDDIQGIFQ